MRAAIKAKLIRLAVQLMDQHSANISGDETILNETHHAKTDPFSFMDEFVELGLVRDHHKEAYRSKPVPEWRWSHRSPITRMMLLDLADQYDSTPAIDH